MNRAVQVTGFGVRTAFGPGAEQVRRGVFAGVPAFAPVTRFDTGPYRSQVAAVGADSLSVADALAETAVAAVGMAGVPVGDRTAVFVGTGGDFAALTRYWRTGGDAAPTVPAWQAEALAVRLGARGPRLAFTSACVASAAAIIHACRMITAGRIDVAVCAGAYLVEEDNFAKFNSGRALSRDGRVRPFSADRSGLLLGDGAAAVVLESRSHAGARGATALADVAGWGDASDAHHIAKPHPGGTGLTRALTAALRRADASGLDYINAHGTATPLNDSAETRGLSAALGDRAGMVPVSSTKSTTGHLLEASGAVEFVITLLALLDGVLPPTAGFSRPDPDCDIDCVPDAPRPAGIRRAATINAAFGGANTALILEHP
jgi:3-oxoacyl-[acyl-carrier-protein] synthase II